MAGGLFGYADVGRVGLGHGLLAWARCVVWCHDRDARVIAPRWLRLRIGPYLRRERDKRFYYRLFRTGRQIGGWSRLRLLVTADRLNAETQMPLPGYRPARSTVVVFANALADNERKHFHEIVGRSGIVREALIDMTCPQFLPPSPRTPHVAIHVRGGDFATPAGIETIKSGSHNLRLPVDWYVEMLAGLRRRLGVDLPAVVYSDCPDAEIAPLFALPRVARSRYKDAITDMLAISGASVLISSGSGFSRWGSYLGQVPRLCFPGQRTVRVLGPVEGGIDLEPECETAGEVPASFCKPIAVRYLTTEDV